jgi:hypothetical protein
VTRPALGGREACRQAELRPYFRDRVAGAVGRREGMAAAVVRMFSSFFDPAIGSTHSANSKGARVARVRGSGHILVRLVVLAGCSGSSSGAHGEALPAVWTRAQSVPSLFA